MRAVHLLPLLFFLAGCEANGPRIQVVHPTGAGDLSRIAQECTRPTSAQYAACMKAAELLEKKTPQEATVAYLANWNHVVLEGGRHRPAVRATDALVPIAVVPPTDKY